MRVVGCTRVKNGERWMRRWVEDMAQFCDFLCVLDDGSDDGTPRILEEAAKRHGNLFLHRQKGLPRDGGRDCNILYDMAASLKADWIFAPDADEFVDPEDFGEIKALVECDRDDVLGWTFPFFYLWDDERHYRADGDYANCHVIRLFRYDAALRPPQRISHSQLCPDELDRRRVRAAPARMVHYGYTDRADREAKHRFYTERDKDPIAAGGGVKNYDHILGAGAVILPYPSRAEWNWATSPRTAWSTERRPVRLGLPSFPGAGPVPDQRPIDEAIIEDVDRTSDLSLLPGVFAQMRPGARLDISCMNFDRWAEDFAAAVKTNDEAEKERLIALMDGTRPLWQTRLTNILASTGFERIELLPVKKTHLIAFKPDGKAQA